MPCNDRRIRTEWPKTESCAGKHETYVRKTRRSAVKMLRSRSDLPRWKQPSNQLSGKANDRQRRFPKDPRSQIRRSRGANLARAMAKRHTGGLPNRDKLTSPTKLLCPRAVRAVAAASSIAKRFPNTKRRLSSVRSIGNSMSTWGVVKHVVVACRAGILCRPPMLWALRTPNWALVRRRPSCF